MGEIATALLLVLAANGAPILATRLLGTRFALPLDGGLRLADGEYLLGPHKTLRGLLAAIAASTILARLLGLPAGLGGAVGLAAMMGDAATSFLKRRRRLGSGDRAGVLDQLPETLLPLLVLHLAGRLDLPGLAAALLFVLATAVLLSRILHGLGIRERPY